MHRLQELVRLHRMDTGCREVARILKMGVNVERTYRRILGAEGLLQGDPDDLPSMELLRELVLKHRPANVPPQQQSTVDAWEADIRDMLERNAAPTAIYDYLRLRYEDFSGSLSAVKRKCLRINQEKGVDPNEVAIPVETDPGEEAQVDFGYVGRLYDPLSQRERKAWIFVLVLAFSRHMFAQIVFDQKVETWLRLHIAAFRTLGGCVQTVVPDNLKAAVIRAAFGVDETTGLNMSYREMARYYGFKIDPTPPRDPKKKGKVESGVKYVKHNFFKPRDFSGVSIRDVQGELDRWVREIAGKRLHGTTGKQPLVVFQEEERKCLRPIPDKPFESVVWKQAKVHQDSHIQFDRKLYSVPWIHIGKAIWVRATPHTVAIYLDNDRIATHDRSYKPLRTTQDSHLPAHRVDWRYRNSRYWEERADRIGDAVGQYIREVFDSDDAFRKLRAVQSIVTYLEKFPPERAQAACKRASYFGNYTYQGIKNIMTKALDLEPLQETQSSTYPPPRMKYARKMKDIFNQKEIHYASN